MLRWRMRSFQRVLRRVVGWEDRRPGWFERRSNASSVKMFAVAMAMVAFDAGGLGLGWVVVAMGLEAMAVLVLDVGMV